MQHITLIGRLGQDPVKKFTKSQMEMWEFSLCVNIKETPIWYTVVCFPPTISFKILETLKKGSLISVTGSLGIPDAYLNKENKPKVSLRMTAHSINFINTKKEEASSLTRESFL